MKFHQTTTDISGNLFKSSIKLGKNNVQNVEKVTKFMVDSLKRARTLWRKEIIHWQQARASRYSQTMPRNFLMQDLYDDVLMDAHLHGITENRTLRTTNKDFIFVDKEGKKNDELTEFIKDKSWFENFIEIAHKSTYYGTGVVFFKETDKNGFTEVEEVRRHSVVPELSMIFTDAGQQTGLNYNEFPFELCEVQMYDRIGLLEKAAPYTILKRHSWGSWDEFEELFGVPIRIAKIASQNETVKKEVAGWLEEMGSAPYAVFPIGTEIDIKENSKGDAFNVFFQKLQELNKELSKLILHQTMTTDNGSSKAQGGVHENTLGEVILADEKKLLAILNDKLVPLMRGNGYNIPEGFKIKVSETKNPKDQILIDGELLRNGYVLKQSYLEDVYGAEIESMPNNTKTEFEQGKKP